MATARYLVPSAMALMPLVRVRRHSGAANRLRAKVSVPCAPSSGSPAGQRRRPCDQYVGRAQRLFARVSAREVPLPIFFVRVAVGTVCPVAAGGVQLAARSRPYSASARLVCMPKMPGPYASASAMRKGGSPTSRRARPCHSGRGQRRLLPSCCRGQSGARGCPRCVGQNLDGRGLAGAVRPTACQRKASSRGLSWLGVSCVTSSSIVCSSCCWRSPKQEVKLVMVGPEFARLRWAARRR